MRNLFLPILSLLVFSAQAQLNIDNATFFIGEGAVVTVQGNLTTNVAIQVGGAGLTQGKILLKGTAIQQINTNGFVIPRLEIDNPGNVALLGDVRVGDRLEFTNGKFQLGDNDFTLSNGVVIVNAGGTKFLETNGTGIARLLLPAAHVAGKEIPVGIGSNYTPFMFTTTGTAPDALDFVGVRASGIPVPVPDRHPRTESYLNTFWEITRSSLPAGTQLAATGTYVDGQFTGTEAEIVGMFFNGTSWSRSGGSQNAATNIVGANVPLDGTMSGLNRFVLASGKVFLHGPFNNTTGLMNDNLRSLGQIPFSDPYRVAPYNYPHAANGNTIAETIDPTVLGAQLNPEENIVDWMLVELLDDNTPAAVIQSRSVLVRRDGLVVDVDGISPVYFKNVNPGTYNIAVRHRNHIGAMTPIPKALGLGIPTIDNFTASAVSAFSNPTLPLYGPLRELPRNGNTSVWGLYSSDGNFNKRTQSTGSPSNNDYSLLLANLTLLTGYHQRDYNMDGVVRTSGSPALNDYSKFLNSLNALNFVQQHEK